jgi:DNA-binding MarR family transcriptional regulator
MAERDPISQLALSVFLANGRLLQWGDRFTAAFGITSARWQILASIGISQRPMTAPILAASMGVTRQGAQKQLNVLCDEGFVHRQQNPQHMRSPCYVLSPPGQRLYEKLADEWAKEQGRLDHHLPNEEILTAARVLNMLSDQIARNESDR